MNEWYQKLNKSSLTPPNYVFSIVWSILYILMFISVGLYLSTNKWTNYGIFLFGLQLLFNLFWTQLFFGYRLLCVSMFELFIILFLLTLTILEFYKVNRTSAYILLPYFIWLILAFYLNSYICIYN